MTVKEKRYEKSLRNILAEAKALVAIVETNRRAKYTGAWKPYMMADAVHQYRCPATRIGQVSGPCNCGATLLLQEFETVWKRLKEAVKKVVDGL